MAWRRFPIREWLVTFLALIGVGITTLISTKLGADLTLPLLPGGIAVAASIRWGRQMWPAIFLARVLTELGLDQPLLHAIGVGAGGAAGSVLTAWILGKRGFDSSFSHARDVPLFIIAGAIGMTLAPTLGLLGSVLGHDASAEISSLHWIRWWSNSTAGVLVVGPILVAASRRSLSQFAEHWLIGCFWVLAVACCCAGALTLGAAGAGRPLVVTFALLLVVVGVIRFGLVVAASGALAMSTSAGLSFVFGIGIFGRLDEIAGFATLWSFSAALTGLGLLVTALLAERDSAALERLQAERRYAQIFDASPQPLWVHDPATLEFLLVNEAAVRQYGWSREELLSQRVPVLAPPDMFAVVPPRASGSGSSAAPEPFETRHRTRDGRVLAVEVWTRDIELGGRPAELVFASDVTERRALGSALIDAIASEQRRIGHELHDGLGQELTGLALSARALATRAGREYPPLSTGLEQLAALAASCIQAARRIAQGVAPLSDADGNLPAVLDALAARSSLGGVTVRSRARLDAAIMLDLETRNHLYRIAQEAVQNALKHAQARHVDIDLWAQGSGVTLAIRDDGIGLPGSAAARRGLGMRTMHFRAGSIGGRLTIASRSGGGVTVSCEVAQPKTVSAIASAG
ncbi:MAG TPA: PAS domain S-box protein [Steroidobacteraceae bacterium]|nr:PAS domain S-box protein [Steroidobacteraceae bacterium]